MQTDEKRLGWAPFVFGGLAALGAAGFEKSITEAAQLSWLAFCFLSLLAALLIIERRLHSDGPRRRRRQRRKTLRNRPSRQR